MAISVMNWVWTHSRSRHGARLTLLAIADCASSDGGNAWPSNKELRRKTGLTERAVRIAVAELIGLGELTVDLNAGPGGCNRYQVITAKPPAKNAPRQNLPPSLESAQLNGHTPAESAPPAKNAPRHALPHPPAESAPGTVLEPKNPPSEGSKRAPAKPPRADVERICAHLAARIEANGSRRPAVTQRWRDAARRLLDLDGRTEQQVHTAIDWCQDDEFWKANVMSLPALREKYDRLRLQAQRASAEHARAGPVTRADKQQEQRARQLARAQERERRDTNGNGAPGGVHPGLLPAADHR